MAAASRDNGAQAPVMDPELKYLLQRTMDSFDHYWRGQHDEWKGQFDRGLREPIIRRLQVPRRRMMPRRADTPPEGPRLDRKLQRRAWGGFRAPDKYKQLEEDIAQGAFGMVHVTQPLGLELRKILGKGGEGVACLFRMIQTDGSERNIVVKAAMRNADMKLEMANMRVWAFGHETHPIEDHDY